MRLEIPEETRLVGYADDVAALIAARTIDLAQFKLNQVMRRVNEWMRVHGLSLALAKTEIVVLTKSRIQTIMPMMVGEEQVETKTAAKYLGVMIDSKLTFGEQIKGTADKAAVAVARLSRLMANTSGPKSSKRRLLMTTVQSILLYGAEVWADTLQKDIYRRRVVSVQRRSALRVACAYRTVSEPAVFVIAGVIPIDLLARERKAIYHRKADEGRKKAAEEERAHTLRRWQEMWDSEHRGRWTARLVPQIRPWLDRQHGEISYYLTQFLSGHGYFRSYLHKMGKVNTPDCLYCVEREDNADHMFFTCSQWTTYRGQVEAELGPLTPDTIVGAMLASEDAWSRIAHYVEEILRMKKRDLDKQQA